MARWPRGEAEIEDLISRGELQKVTGAAADGRHQIARSAATLHSAVQLVESDPDSAFILAYDAARHALTALLAHQGLRPTTKGGHLAVEQAALAQFGPGFRVFSALRRRRHDLEYPQWAGGEADPAEARECISSSREILSAAERLVDQLGSF